MKLIDVLASGVNGAPLGSATIMGRGTSNSATYYKDFEATQQSTGAVALDSNGAAIVYVNTLVTVTVFDVNGVQVRQFTAGEAASSVEVISQSFTGTDYTSGATGTSKPTTLATVLDKWLTSAGAADWNVLFGGSSITLQQAVAGAINFYNVQAPQFGAKGDKTTDDTGAIQAAINAAAAAGGGTVFFPAATGYKITAPLTFTTTNAEAVNLLGVGFASTIFQATTNANTLQFSKSTTTSKQYVRDLGFWSIGTQTVDVVSITGSSRVDIDNCRILTGTGNGIGVTNAATSAQLLVRNTHFELGVTPSRAVNIAGTSATVQFLMMQCDLQCLSTYSAGVSDTWVSAPTGMVIGCSFNMTGVNAGTLAGITQATQTGSEGLTVIGCQFITSGSAFTPALADGPSSLISEYGNVATDSFGGIASLYSNETLTAVPTSGQSPPGGHRSLDAATWVTTQDSNITLAFNSYGIYSERRTTNAAQQITISPTPALGRVLTVVVHNDSGGTIAAGTQTVRNATPANVGILANNLLTGSAVIWVFKVVPVLVSGTVHKALVQIGYQDNVAFI